MHGEVIVVDDKEEVVRVPEYLNNTSKIITNKNRGRNRVEQGTISWGPHSPDVQVRGSS